ncbi:MAG: hypothetical protein GFH27_549279n348 [Chloroflexi bacterium AL-W]|nr:hypothetical protein [Chloroflexi bacterium AL-N1]NOK65314.1 hypothetical protein [Chloroflexi bacterium AL-N10]NOK72421.1 hypothetical protein [Chloroflexi bacterium AL-N5]NOK79493.1 hypothetical protein [Chloroflexi bacterium AL-W]NOK87409.1 hypothetical protein [Chloroflexi bacterium AL-N15]
MSKDHSKSNATAQILVSISYLLDSRHNTTTDMWKHFLASAEITDVPHQTLVEIVKDVIACLCTEPFDTIQAQNAGKKLFDLYCNQPTLFGKTQQFIIHTLTIELEKEHLVLLLPRILGFCSACTDGFVSCMQNTVIATREQNPIDLLHCVGDDSKASEIELFDEETHPLRLSVRELEILECVATGMTNKAIAAKLNLSWTTIKWHLEQIYHKLQVTNRTAAVHRARSLKLLS